MDPDLPEDAHLSPVQLKVSKNGLLRPSKHRVSRCSRTSSGSQRARRDHHGGTVASARVTCRVPVCIARGRRDNGAWMRGLYAALSCIRRVKKSCLLNYYCGPGRRLGPLVVPPHPVTKAGPPGDNTKHQTEHRKPWTSVTHE